MGVNAAKSAGDRDMNAGEAGAAGAAGEQTRSATSLQARLEKLLPVWITSNLHDKRTWKTFIRCWLSTFATFILLLPERSLEALGNAAFFCTLVSLMLPPNMPVQLFFFTISLMLLGMLLGWATGAATMAAAVKARSQVLLRSEYEIAEQTAATAANPDAQFELEIFQGVFLDWRSSLVYGCMYGVFSFMFATGRAYRPQLALFFIFGQIFLNIFCTFGPLFPNTQYTILSSMLICVSSYLAIGLFCCIFIFPETMSHQYLTATAKLLGQFKAYIGGLGPILDLSPEDMITDEGGDIDRIMKLRLAMVMSIKDLQGKTLINLEFSYGRWNGSDAKDLEKPLATIIGRLSGFSTFHKLVGINATSRPMSRTATKASDGEMSEISSIEPVGDTELIRQLNTRRIAMESEHGLRLEDILPLLGSSTANLRAACAEAVGAAQEYITEVNSTRWHRARNLPEKEAAVDAAIERLRVAADIFKTDERMVLIKPFLSLLASADESGGSPRRMPLRSLIVTSSFAAQLLILADSILDLLILIQDTSGKRQKARVWAPKGLRALAKVFTSRDRGGVVERNLGEDALVEVEEEEEKAESDQSYKLDPDSRPPTNMFQRIMDGVHSAYKWLGTPEALFAIKYTVVTIALWLPAVIRSSAEFYYVNKGVWALIMAQMSLNVYASDQIYGVVTRFIGTTIGLIFGLLIWYIGSGNGNGNPYGIAAAFGVFTLPTVFTRITAPVTLFQPIIIFAATVSLIVGYSWVDGHLTVLSSPGIGWPIAWKRFVLVVIGFAAATIMMMIPPTSGRKAVRMRHASIVSELSSFYSNLMSVWITEAPANKSNNSIDEEKDASADKEAQRVSIAPAVDAPWVDPLRKRATALADQLGRMQMSTSMAKFEGSIRGAWPSELYLKLLDHERDMVAAFSQLANALRHLDPYWRTSLNRQTMILHPNFITDVMSIFALVSQSLRTGEPIHQIMPTSLLDRLVYHSSHQELSSRAEPAPQLKLVDRVKSFDFLFFATGIAAVSQAINALDGMHATTRQLCGEVPFKGFNQWKDEYDRSHAMP